MRRRPPATDGLALLAGVLPVLAVRLGHMAVHLARREMRMIRETAEGIVWGLECPARPCMHEEWCIRCEPPCYGCRCRG
ncbi:MAG: hypothetical protein M0002_14925 [Rhodospirillales bacterium]|nr:hypothetical protein [Rhodospirillales bacterium]